VVEGVGEDLHGRPARRLAGVVGQGAHPPSGVGQAAGDGGAGVAVRAGDQIEPGVVVALAHRRGTLPTGAGTPLVGGPGIGQRLAMATETSTVELTVVDAFTDVPFAGNPAAVCVLEAPAPEAWMQAVAAEMNLSETAFLVPTGDLRWSLRWFTPTVEVDLCGHATLASARVL